MLVWTSLITRDQRRAWLSISGFVLGALLFVHLAGFYGWTVPWIVAAALLGAFVVRAVGAAGWFLVRQPFRACDLGLTEAVAPGGAIRCVIRILPRRAVEIEEIRVGCRGERSEAGGVSERLFEVERRVVRNTRLAAGEAVEFEAELPIPEDAPFSYRSFAGRIRCLVRARLETSALGVTEEEIEVLLAPAT